MVGTSRRGGLTHRYPHSLHEDSRCLNYVAILDAYSLEEILELNDITNEEALDYLVTQGFIELPRIKPLDFE